jgi:hypothetical protein
MDEPKSIELAPREFRQVLNKPLTSPALLWRSVAIAAVATVAASFAAWQLGGFWAALLPVPCALWLGVGLAGLFPGWFFGNSD